MKEILETMIPVVNVFCVRKLNLLINWEHLVHVCSDVLEGKANLQKFIDEVCLTLEWVLNHCLLYIGGLDNVDYITNKSVKMIQ